MPSTHTNLHYHFIFSTKDHIPLIRTEWSQRLHAYLGGIVRGLDGVPLAVGGMADHVHLLTGLTSSHRIDYFLRDVKADSSAFVKKEFDPKFSWQKGYGAFTVSPTGVEPVKRYILDQDAHHRGKSFEQEYIELLDKSNTPYDKRFLW